jgi:hypothetical protein
MPDYHNEASLLQKDKPHCDILTLNRSNKTAAEWKKKSPYCGRGSSLDLNLGKVGL